MKIQMISDIHLDFFGRYYDQFFVQLKVSAPHLVIAGDMAQGSNPLFPNMVKRVCSMFETVIYVPGNHEYYDSSPVEVHSLLRDVKANNPNFLCFQNEMITVDTLNIYGGTMWFSPLDTPLIPMPGYRTRIQNDFHCIKDFEPWVYEQNKAFLDGLALVTPDMVISHHLPTMKSLPDESRRYLQREAFYVCPVLDVQDIVTRPKVWVHGHVHESGDYEYKGTRIVSNPYGYYRRNVNQDFLFDKVIEV